MGNDGDCTHNDDGDGGERCGLGLETELDHGEGETDVAAGEDNGHTVESDLSTSPVPADPFILGSERRMRW